MAIWKRVANWTYEVFDRDTPAECFGEFEPLVRMWQAKRGDSEMPSWADFDFYDFKGWHGSIAIQDVIDEPFDLRCRLWGSRLTDIFGSDNTGKLFSEFGAGYTDNDREFLAEVCRSGWIGMSHGKLDWLRMGHKTAAFIDLPLSNEGSTVNNLLTALAKNTIE